MRSENRRPALTLQKESSCSRRAANKLPDGYVTYRSGRELASPKVICGGVVELLGVMLSLSGPRSRRSGGDVEKECEGPDGPAARAREAVPRARQVDIRGCRRQGPCQTFWLEEAQRQITANDELASASDSALRPMTTVSDDRSTIHLWFPAQAPFSTRISRRLAPEDGLAR